LNAIEIAMSSVIEPVCAKLLGAGPDVARVAVGEAAPGHPGPAVARHQRDRALDAADVLAGAHHREVGRAVGLADDRVVGGVVAVAGLVVVGVDVAQEVHVGDVVDRDVGQVHVHQDEDAAVEDREVLLDVDHAGDRRRRPPRHPRAVAIAAQVGHALGRAQRTRHLELAVAVVVVGHAGDLHGPALLGRARREEVAVVVGPVGAGRIGHEADLAGDLARARVPPGRRHVVLGAERGVGVEADLDVVAAQERRATHRHRVAHRGHARPAREPAGEARLDPARRVAAVARDRVTVVARLRRLDLAVAAGDAVRIRRALGVGAVGQPVEVLIGPVAAVELQRRRRGAHLRRRIFRAGTACRKDESDRERQDSRVSSLHRSLTGKRRTSRRRATSPRTRSLPR
jgi:hypothetical protein